ncbi:MAG: membrane-spanning protein [Lachnoclostridium sp.]|nr:membrane-spanning protein [Lachnoclostridium sp.]MBQ6686542.1 AbrB family transcriptional regulator [Bacillota bacterium]
MEGKLILTLLAAFVCGIGMKKMKVPAGLLVGAILGACILNLGFEMAYMPKAAKLAAQIVAGAFIGSMVSRDDIIKMKDIYKIALVVVGAFCGLNIIVGYYTYWRTDYDLLTMLMCTIPGGLSDVPLIAADMGADLLPVVTVHFARALVGIGIFPAMIGYVCRNDESAEEKHEMEEAVKVAQVNKKIDLKTTLITSVMAIAFGLLGNCIGIPAGALVFSAVGIAVVKVGFGYNAGMPKEIKKAAQVLSGAYIGCTITREAFHDMNQLIEPLIVILLCYTVLMFVIGNFLHKKLHVQRREAMLMMTPAGAGDMALIASDLGVDSPSLIVVQVIRLFVADAIMPQVCRLIAAAFT